LGPEEFAEDRYQVALRDLVERKVKGQPPIMPKVAAPAGNVVNLMDALKRSLAAEGRKPPAASKKRAAPAKAKSGKRRKA
jgi:DNA end-binding protein Ku